MSQKTDPPNSSRIKENGWYQGAVLSDDIIKDNTAIQSAINNINHTGTMIGVVVSQDCDVVHVSFDTEPLVEILLGKIIDKKNFIPGCTNCQSSRKLHVLITPLDSSTNETRVEFHANDRIRIDRTLLCDFKPNLSLKLSNDIIETIRHWIALRYYRPAFPDAFGERIQNKKEKIKNLLKKEPSSYLSSIYLLLRPDDELPAGSSYDIGIVGCMRAGDFETVQKKVEAESLLGELGAMIDSCPGIDVTFASPISERNFSLHDLRTWKRWSIYDYITVRESSATDIPSSH